MGGNLKNFRLSIGFTQEQMAERIGFSRPYYNAIELGLKPGSMRFWQTIEKQFNLSESKVWGLTKLK